MDRIVTLTLNPAIDGAAEADKVQPIRKVRTWGERYDPGGGGINACRVIQDLGGSALAVYLSGGWTGPILDNLVEAAGLQMRRVPIVGHTRVSYTVHERSSGQEYRFVPEGPAIDESEWQACLAVMEDCAFSILLASGSLPRGVPLDFYRRVAAIAQRKGARFVLDTSGEALKETLKERVYVVKPSLGEMEQLVGRKLESASEQEAAAAHVVREGMAEIVALTLGRNGAVLATSEGLWRLDGIPVAQKSAVGAGDSFLAAMTLALAQGKSPVDAFAWGVAAGTAAVMTVGTELCRRSDVERIYEQIQQGGGPRLLADQTAGRA